LRGDSDAAMGPPYRCGKLSSAPRDYRRFAPRRVSRWLRRRPWKPRTQVSLSRRAASQGASIGLRTLTTMVRLGPVQCLAVKPASTNRQG